MYEVEQKYRVRNLAHIRCRLKSLGARKIKSGKEHNEFYDRNGFLQRRRGIVRLRKFGGDRVILTYKGPRLRSRFSKRLEIETPVKFHETQALLRLMGFQMIKKYSKFREEFKIRKCLVTLDRVPRLGSFLEIEAPPADIARLEKKLMLTPKQRESKTYLELLSALKI